LIEIPFCNDSILQRCLGLAPGACVIRLDEGLRSQFESAAPVLDRLGVPALFFATVAAPRWSTDPHRARAGRAGRVVAAIEGPALEEIGGKSVPFVAYPYGPFEEVSG
jgi:hypothetical protein